MAADPGASRPPGRVDVTWDELRQHAEGRWRLTGPDSQGGTTLYRCNGRLYTVAYGDRSELPDGAEQVIAVREDNQREDVISTMGPAVLDEALRCAARRLGRRPA